MYYGMPEKSVDKLETLHSDVLGIFANKDQNITPAVVDDFASNMKKAGKTLILYRYDAVHAFANPSNPGYDKAAREEAYKHSMAFLKERAK
jgi:carboxymethylenebutenolidase